MGDDDADFDLPEIELDDEDYEAFLAREFGADGKPRGEPKIGRLVIVLIVLLLAWLVILLQ